jgi:hypothetical protein
MPSRFSVPMRTSPRFSTPRSGREVRGVERVQRDDISRVEGIQLGADGRGLQRAKLIANGKS